MAPKHHPTPLSEGSARRRSLARRATTGILAAQSVEMRAEGAALIQQAD
jgi:hypothetical protein